MDRCDRCLMTFQVYTTKRKIWMYRPRRTLNYFRDLCYFVDGIDINHCVTCISNYKYLFPGYLGFQTDNINCFCFPERLQFLYTCIYNASSFHRKLTCSRHDISENCWVGVKQQSLTENEIKMNDNEVLNNIKIKGGTTALKCLCENVWNTRNFWRLTKMNDTRWQTSWSTFWILDKKYSTHLIYRICFFVRNYDKRLALTGSIENASFSEIIAHGWYSPGLEKMLLVNDSHTQNYCYQSCLENPRVLRCSVDRYGSLRQN